MAACVLYPVSGWDTCSATPPFAARDGHLDVVWILIDAGADNNVRNGNGIAAHEGGCLDICSDEWSIKSPKL